MHVPQHWQENSWEQKAQENPLFAIMTAESMEDAPSTDFSPDQLEIFFAKGKQLFEQHLKSLLPQLNHGEPPLIAEYGCGAGRILKYIADAGYRTAGIDISQTMLDNCRKIAPQVQQLHLLDARGRIGMSDASADMVYSYAVVQHIGSLKAYTTAMNEMCRILKPGCVLAMQVNCEDFHHGDINTAWRTANFEKFSLHFRPGKIWPYKFHRQDTWSGVYIGDAQLTKMLAKYGITVERRYYHKLKKPRGVWYICRKAPTL